MVTVVDSKNCLTQMKGGGDPNASGGLSDWLRQVLIVKQSTQLVGLIRSCKGHTISHFGCLKVGVADLIVVNKTDLVEPAHLDHVLQMVGASS